MRKEMTMQPRHFIHLIISFAVLSACLTSASPTQAQEGTYAAEVIAISGQAEIKAGGGSYQPAKLRDRLNNGDSIRTLDKSRAKVLFRDESVTVLGEKTTFEIANFNYDPATRQRQSLLKTVEGKIRFTIQKFAGAPDPNTVIETQVLSVGVRGTDGILDASELNKVYLFESALPLLLKNKFTGQTIKLMPMQFAVTGKDRPFQINAITPQMLESLLKQFRLAYTFEPKNLLYPTPSQPLSFFVSNPDQLPVTMPPVVQQPLLPPVVQQPLPAWHNRNQTTRSR